MLIFLLAYAGGVLTIVSPCILPVVPFVFRRAVLAELQIAYPVAVDNEHAIWRAFDNRYWPAHYFIDAEGRVRHHHFGEGGYDESERVIHHTGWTSTPTVKAW